MYMLDFQYHEHIHIVGGVTILPNTAAPKRVHVKLQQKYILIKNIIIYLHIKFELKKKFAQGEKKRKSAHE